MDSPTLQIRATLSEDPYSQAQRVVRATVPDIRTSLSIFFSGARNPTRPMALQRSRVKPAGAISGCDVQVMANENEKRRKPEEGAALEEARLRQQAIGVKLRHMFDEVVNEPVPGEFLDILRRADEKRGGGA